MIIRQTRQPLRHLFLTLLFAVAVSGLAAQAVPVDRYRGLQPVMVVFSSDRDDVRPFEFNLALSTNWDRILSREIAVLDVGPLAYDVEAVARQLELGTRDFAIVLIGRDGSQLMTTEDPGDLGELLRRLDLHRNEEDEP